MQQLTAYLAPLIGIVIWSSCQNKDFDRESLALVPVENIQVYFDRIDGASDSIHKALFKESRGNYFLVNNIDSLKSYIKKHNTELLLSPQLQFIWNLHPPQEELYLVDSEKKFDLKVSQVNKISLSTNDTVSANSRSNALELILSTKNKLSMSSFFVKNIGKKLILIDRNGWVAGSAQLSKSEEGNLILQPL